MAIKCTARAMSASIRGHEHIAGLYWSQDDTGKTGFSSRADMVAYVKQYGDTAVWCPDQAGGRGQWVHVNNNGRVEYVQTYADGRWTDDLLALPEKR